MKHTLLGTLTGAALIAAYGMASAQDAKIMDGINPAPNYAPSSTRPTPQTGTVKIMDGINPAPNYSAAPAGKSSTTSSRIMDGNNPSPNYAASSAATLVRTARKATDAQHATHRHKAHTPAS